ncbi:MAG: putative UBA/THIF-type binding protein [Herminiimonas sp.]|nr:putative UBA/THIF-type binding protein [Herminiimonas sp.]
MERFDRNERLFGKEGQEKMRASHIAIVGCGGLGTHVIQQAAYFGYGKMSLIDDERLDRTNLNRYVLATPADLLGEPPLKVDLAIRAVYAIDPTIDVVRVPESVRSAAAFEVLSKADLIFGCLDNDGARLILTEFALAYRKTYFDLATDVPEEAPSHFGGRVYLTAEEDGCLVCAREIDPAQATKELESEAARRDRDAIYGVKKSALGTAGPSVVSLNGVVASMALTEAMCHVTGLRIARKHLKYHGQRGTVSANQDPPQPNCFYCGRLKGAGASAGVERHLK